MKITKEDLYEGLQFYNTNNNNCQIINIKDTKCIVKHRGFNFLHDISQVVYYINENKYKLKDADLSRVKLIIKNRETILKTNTNEKTGKIVTDNGRKKTQAAIKFNSKGKITTASPLIGNSISASFKRRKIGKFEIFNNAISC